MFQILKVALERSCLVQSRQIHPIRQIRYKKETSVFLRLNGLGDGFVGIRLGDAVGDTVYTRAGDALGDGVVGNGVGDAAGWRWT